jgi:hypothetical protein
VTWPGRPEDLLRETAAIFFAAEFLQLAILSRFDVALIIGNDGANTDFERDERLSANEPLGLTGDAGLCSIERFP